jgi:hypothetical protein
MQNLRNASQGSRAIGSKDALHYIYFASSLLHSPVQLVFLHSKQKKACFIVFQITLRPVLNHIYIYMIYILYLSLYNLSQREWQVRVIFVEVQKNPQNMIDQVLAIHFYTSC